MTQGEARQALIDAYLEKTDRAAGSMRRDLSAGDANLAISRAYYACFYGASAVLLKEGRRFVKHAGVRSGVHAVLINTGRLQVDMGRFYERVFAARSRADYDVEQDFSTEEAEEIANQADLFVGMMKKLLV